MNWRIADWFPELNAESYSRLATVHKELLRFNEKLNLVSEKTIHDADLWHFADSICAFNKLGGLKDQRFLFDIGSGNGFPGLILAILNRELEVHLVEKDQRKAEYLKHVVGVAGVNNARVESISVEALPEGSVPCAISRGFAPLGKALLLTRKVFRIGGRYFHMKGSQWATEVAQLPPQVCSVWQASHAGSYTLPGGSPPAELNMVVTTRVE